MRFIYEVQYEEQIVLSHSSKVTRKENSHSRTVPAAHVGGVIT